MNLVVRWIISAVAVGAAAWLLPGITMEGNGVIVLLVMAAVLGLVNAVVRPILTALSCPLVLLTMGLFLLVINAFAFWLAGWLSTNVLDMPFRIDGPIDALLGSIIVSIVGAILTTFVQD